jgi:hypothetical protein
VAFCMIVKHLRTLAVGLIFPLAASDAFSFSSVATSEDRDWCATCHANRPPESPQSTNAAPLLPEVFSMNWQMYEIESDQRPPFDDAAAISRGVIHGSTYYNWKERKMTEIYRERCIDIFPDGRDFPCQFTSIGNQTYFIKYSRSMPPEPQACCLWSKNEFWAPRPDVLRNMTQDLSQAATSKTAWWILDIPFPGPFGYGTGTTNGVPVAFWFPVINGWVQQEFSDFISEKPAETYFQLPSVCTPSPPVCGAP